MKFAICVVLVSLCVLAGARPYETSWGDVHKPELGRRILHKAIAEGERLATYTFTYPMEPSKLPICGVRQIDRNPPTKVEFVKGNIGDHQITIKVTAAKGHDLSTVFVFYVDKWPTKFFGS